MIAYDGAHGPYGPGHAPQVVVDVKLLRYP